MGKCLEKLSWNICPLKEHVCAPERTPYWNLGIVAIVPALVFRAKDVSSVMPILNMAKVVAHGYQVVNCIAM